MNDQEKENFLSVLKEKAKTDLHKVGKFNYLLVLLLTELPIPYSKFKFISAPCWQGRVIYKNNTYCLSPRTFDAWKDLKIRNLLPLYLDCNTVCKKLKRLRNRYNLDYDITIKSLSPICKYKKEKKDRFNRIMVYIKKDKLYQLELEKEKLEHDLIALECEYDFPTSSILNGYYG